MARPTRTLVDIACLLAVAWLWIAIYESFTRSGLWLIISRAVGGATTLPSELAVLVMCVLAGWLPIVLVLWLVWRVALHGRVERDFPAAKQIR